MGQTTEVNTNNQLFVNNDTSKIFIGDNRHDSFTLSFENTTNDDVTLPAGTLLGQVSATLKVKKHSSIASDNSQYPIGILAQDITVLYGETYDGPATVCVEGRVAQDKVLLRSGDTLDTLVSGRTIRARIGSDTVGIKLVPSTEMTGYDNT